MILHINDYNTQNVVIHSQTNNLSFIKMHKLLRQLGVKNNLFFLALHDKELAPYDPHHLKDTSEELRGRIAIEAKINPWYYYREIIRLPYVGDEGTPFILNRMNLATLWLFYNGVDIMVTGPRQFGKTVGGLAIASHLQNIATVNFDLVSFAPNTDLNQENVDRLKFIKDNLPAYLVDSNSYNDNKEGLLYKALNNNFKTLVAQSDKRNARKFGRGNTTSFILGDEVAFCVNIDLSYPSLVACTTEAMTQARRSFMPCGMILATTAGQLDDPSGKYVHDEIKSKAASWTDFYFDLGSTKELRLFLKHNSLNDMFYIVYSYLQLGKNKEWLQDTIRRVGGTPDEQARDWFNIWTSGSADGALSAELLHKLKDKEKDPCFVTTVDGYCFKWYQPQEIVENVLFKHRSFILGMDSSENIGNDFTTLTLIDPRTLAVVATCRCNETNINLLANTIARFLIEWKNTLFIPERNHTGSTIIDTILLHFEREGIDPFTRIYNTVFQELDDSDIRQASLDFHGKGRAAFGFRTTAAANSRTLLYKSVLPTAINMGSDDINDSTIIDEMRALTIRNGRVDHRIGGNDDQLISYLLACYVIFHGRNIKRYCIDPFDILSEIKKTKEGYNSEDVALQKSYYREYTDIQSRLKQVKNPAFIKVYERRLNELKSIMKPELLSEEDLTVYNIEKDKDIKKERQKNTSLSIVKHFLAA